MKFHFETLGCKVNSFESQALVQLAQERGHEIVQSDADAIILNTCAVTANSEHKCIRALHQLRRKNPNAIILACGCLAEISPGRLLETGEVDLISGTVDRGRTIELCEQAVQGIAPGCMNGSDTRKFECLPAGVPQGRTRALLKIQDGCDNYCTYCIIPYARGHVRSMPKESVLAEVEKLRANGINEIVLTGIEIASYGSDIGITLLELLDAVLSAAPDVRFRLSSLEPQIADESFCAMLAAHGNIAPQFHLSLQSGSDTILRKMGRRYTKQIYYENISRLRRYFPDCTITTDLIVGFPGEGEHEFIESMDFLRLCSFSDVHVFPFSAREGTVAFTFPEKLTRTQKEERAVFARKVAEELSINDRLKRIDKEQNVLLEHRTPDGFWSGHGDYCFPIYVGLQNGGKNRTCTVRIAGLKHDGLLGVPLQSE